MKKIFSALGLMILVSGCTSPVVKEEPVIEARQPSSNNTQVFSDEYDDYSVYFCDAGSAIVSIDPNRCGKAQAAGRGCTEMASYSSPRLTVKSSGNLIKLAASNGKVLHTLAKSGNDSYVMAKGRWNQDRVDLKLKAAEQDQINHICNKSQN